MAEINIRDLAKELNLSIGTVSKALRDSHEISALTKEKVFALARQLNYTPNPYASSLRGKKSKTIGVVIPEIADSFFSHAIKGIESVAQKKGYHVLIYLTEESFLKEEFILSEFKSGRVDGVLLSISRETSNSRHIEELKKKGIPLVLFDRTEEEIPTTKIITNDLESSYKATHHLIKRGCKKISFLSISRHLSINNKRIEGFLKALNDHLAGACKNNIVDCTNDDKQNQAIVHKILERAERPDGIICSVEKLTIPVYLSCRGLQLNIPKDIKIISFSNSEAAPVMNPSLTTVTQPAYEMGKRAATILFKAVEKKNFKMPNENIIIPSSLIIRNSTD
ncbi:MAG: LacI family DNA-binding transcriptional regulator [Ferruginibacter sp.]